MATRPPLPHPTFTAMPVVKRTETAKLRALLQAERPPQVFLVHGERFLCQELAAEIVAGLLPGEEERHLGLVRIDGDEEDPARTLGQLKTYGLFGGRRVFLVNDSRLLLSRHSARDLWDKAQQAHDKEHLPRAAALVHRMLAASGQPDLTPAELAGWQSADWQAKLGFAPQGDTAWLAALPPANHRGRGTADLEEAYCQTLADGLLDGHFLLLLAETADRRKRLYKCIADHGVVVDGTVATGSSRAAATSRDEVIRQVVRRTLEGFGLEIRTATLNKLVERTGFHPDAAKMEAEKLALYVLPATRVTDDHLEAVGSRTREDAIYELNEAVAGGHTHRALVLARRLQDSGTHPLAIISGLRNHLARLRLARALQLLDPPGYHPGLAFPRFQQDYLPRLKEQYPGELKDLPGHPYALYMLFKTAAAFPLRRLHWGLDLLLDLEFTIKSSSPPPALLLDHFLVAFTTGAQP